MFRTNGLLVLVSLAAANAAPAADWPQWLGPTRDGVSVEKVPVWKAPLRIVWKMPAGPGFSSPVVAKGRVFIHAQCKDKQAEELIAFDAATGKQLWRESYPRATYLSAVGGGPAATPTVVGNRVYAFGITGVLACYQADTGKQLWLKDVYAELKAAVPRFGVCCSPLLIGNRVLASIGGKGRSIISLDAATGEILWKAFDDPASTASPVLHQARGVDDSTPAVVFMTSSRLLAVDPLDGQLRWEAPLVFRPSGTSPTPLLLGDFIVTSTTSTGTIATRVDSGSQAPTARQAWQNKNVGGYFSTGVPCGDNRVCLVTNVLMPIPSASLCCVDLLTGKEVWKKSGIGYFHIGVIRLGDNRLLVLDDGGTLKLFEPAATDCKELAKAKVCGGTLVTPALANGKLFARDGSDIVCVDLGTK